MALELTAAARVVFHLTLHRDGSISRKGTARLRDPDRPLALGQVGPGLFADALSDVPADLLDGGGWFDIPGSRGEAMVLDIRLAAAGAEIRNRIAYRSDDSGPPEAIVRWVLRLRSLTDDWYAEGLRAAGNAR